MLLFLSAFRLHLVPGLKPTPKTRELWLKSWWLVAVAANTTNNNRFRDRYGRSIHGPCHQAVVLLGADVLQEMRVKEEVFNPQFEHGRRLSTFNYSAG